MYIYVYVIAKAVYITKRERLIIVSHKMLSLGVGIAMAATYRLHPYLWNQPSNGASTTS